MINKQSGFVLIPIMITLVVVSALIYLMNIDSAQSVGQAKKKQIAQEKKHLLRAATKHVKWWLQQKSCSNYGGLSNVNFDDHSYSFSFAPNNSSPVTATIVTQHKDGAAQTATVTNIKSYDSISSNKTLQYSALLTNDSYIDDSKQTTNYGTKTNLKLSNTSFERIYIMMQLPAFDYVRNSMHIDNANLELYLSIGVGENSNIPVVIYPLVQKWDVTAVNWLSRQTATPWLVAGGDIESDAISTTILDTNNSGWNSWDITSHLKALQRGKSNYGLQFRATSSTSLVESSSLSFTSSKKNNCAKRPRLAITYRCECGQTCSFTPRIPNLKISCLVDKEVQKLKINTSFNLTASDPYGITFIPSCLQLFNVEIPSNGALLVTDYGNKKFMLLSMTGQVLALVDTPHPKIRVTTLVYEGKWAGYLAATDYDLQKVYYLDTDGQEVGSIDITATTQASGITSIYNSASGIYDGDFAITSDKDGTGSSVPTLFIVDQDGVVQKTINIAHFATLPWDIAHIPGQDKFLLAEYTDNRIYKIDFNGNVLETKKLGSVVLNGIGIEYNSCKYAVIDTTASKIKFYEQ